MTFNLFKSFTCPHLSQDLVFIKDLHGDQSNHYNARSVWMCSKCHKLIYRNQLFNMGDYSDGYHTFTELYYHRMILFAVVCHNYPEKCWKSAFHSDGSMYENMFIVGIDTPEGPATYHYDLTYWGTFKVKELEKAPVWDGHTSETAIKRIASFLNEPLKENTKEVIYPQPEPTKRKKLFGIF